MTRDVTRQLLEAAAAHHRAGRDREAVEAYRQVLARAPDSAEALAGLGALALRGNRPADAAGPLSRAVQLRPDVGPLRAQFAAALRALGRWPEALEQSRQAAALQPHSADAVCELGTMLGAVGREQESVAAYRRALALDPDHPAANYNLAVTLQKRRQFAEAAEALRRTVRRSPNFAMAHNNLGSVLRELGALEESVACYRRAMQLEPRESRYWNNIALAYQDQGRLDEALASYDAALRLRPDYVKARAFRALALLLTGDYARGLADYEARREVEGHFVDRSHGRPLWDGSDVSGKTVLLHSEQGLGDTIHFARYAPLLAGRGARVIVQCQAPLEGLMEASLVPRGVSRVLTDGDAVPEFDLYCPLPGLPYRFGTRVETIPADVPYLSAPADRVAVWRERLVNEPVAATRRVGIVWAGARGHRNDHKRSVALSMFAPLAAVPGVKLYSLQKGDSAAADLATRPPEMAVEDWGNHFADFADTAAAMMNLDLVICVDTSVAHLAGALGRPVWTLLPFAPDWRWMLGRSDSPWYPTMRLFRQPRPGDWGSVFVEVVGALRDQMGHAGPEPESA